MPQKAEPVRREEGTDKADNPAFQDSDRDAGKDMAEPEEAEELTLSREDKKLLRYYHRLDEEDREYILCKIVVLEREYTE